MYSTYRRAALRSSFLSWLYNSLMVVVVCIVLPLYVVFQHGHLDVDKGGNGYVDARLTNPPGGPRCGEELSGYGCEVLDWLEAVTARGGDMFVATFVQEELQRRSCPRGSRECPDGVWE
eukprot:Hpha_TRINITY_DN23318_c0_g1::TRINITY_DN23318_c0_g1_i1::g.96990::m.96990